MVDYLCILLLLVHIVLTKYLMIWHEYMDYGDEPVLVRELVGPEEFEQCKPSHGFLTDELAIRIRRQ